MPGPLPSITPVTQPYWDAAREQRLSLPRCRECGLLFAPPSTVCPDCLSPELEWVTLSGRGTVWSWVVFHRTYFKELPAPYTVLRVQLDEGPRILANLVGGDSGLAIGAPVEVVFEQYPDRTIPQFRLTRPARQ